ncbi:MAG TPA: 8-oxo-dGTP diphosphatase MutT [Cytophagales bacterium]|nr:8-oxo-dGTP diphosphatase MutT [Cytophagales bacterium]HAA22507.1 8-oxo-dGTP diphosphatase MutT [Cytophagales bacterium]HAP61376.1 8-oxo-dGTP diphosphatase MutT [Cytophagales bacterium]
MSSSTPLIHLLVTAALLVRNGRYLLAKRPQGKHLAGYWEFPGGKVQENETPAQALRRELKEELGIHVQVGDLFLDHTHQYPDRQVRLLTIQCQTQEEPQALEHDELIWLKPEEMRQYPISPADEAVIDLLLVRGA